MCPETCYNAFMNEEKERAVLLCRKYVPLLAAGVIYAWSILNHFNAEQA